MPQSDRAHPEVESDDGKGSFIGEIAEVRLHDLSAENHLSLQATGVWTDHNARGVIDRIAALIAAGGHRRLLIDCRPLDVAIDSRQADYETAEYAATATLGLHCRIACVLRAEHLERSRFLETTAANRGVALRYFAEPAEARAWLFA